MKILVTGGAGFIGSAVVRYVINETSDSVVNLDKLTYAGNLESVASVSHSSRYAFERVDVCDRAELERVFNHHQPDVVMHLAAESHVDRSIECPASFIETNIIGTYILLEVVRDYWIQLEANKKALFCFHHVSTDEVYGDLAETNDLFDEECPYKPSSPYSASKASSDHLVRAWYRTYGLPIVITNSSNNYGPFQHSEKFIPKMILNALEGKPLTLYGNGLQSRDWLYVEDHAKTLYKVITEGKIGETYNIGGHCEKKNIEVVKSICFIMEKLFPVGVSTCFLSKHIDYISLVKYVEDRAGHDFRYALDINKIEKELGWKPKESFESGIEKTIKWYLGIRW